MKSVSWLKDWRVLAFVDAGEVKVKSPLPEQISRTTLASVGLGTRLKITSQLSLAVDAAKTLHEGAKTPEDHWRMDAQVRWQF
jgi:outer membrane autotransporter protein